MWQRLNSSAKRFGRQHLLNFISFFVSKAISLGLFAFAVAYFIRRSGARPYGIVSLVLLLYTYLQMVDMGMGYAVVFRLGRSIARGGRNKALIVSEALPVYLICSIIIASVLISFSTPISRLLLGSDSYSHLFAMVGIGITFLILSSLCVAVMQAFNHVYLVNMSRLVFDLVKALSLVAAVGTRTELDTVVWITISGALLRLCLDICLVSYLIGSFRWLRPKFSWRAQRLNIKIGSPMFISSLTFSVINSIDKIFVARFISSAALAVYSIASDLHAKAFFLLWAVTGSLYTPLIHKQARRESVRRLIWIEAIAIIGILIVYYIPLTIFSRTILSRWIGESFSQSGYQQVRWFLVPTCIYLIANPMEVYLQTAGETKKIGWAYVCALLAEVAGLLLLPVRYGVVGVILSQAAMHLTLLLFFLFIILGGKRAGLQANTIIDTSINESFV